MKIGYFTSIEGWGGSETYLESLIKGVRAAGHEPICFGIEGTKLFQRLRREGVKCIAWRSLPEKTEKEPYSPGVVHFSFKTWLLDNIPTWFKMAVGIIREVRILCHLFRANSIDVVHVNISGYEVAGIACRIAGIPSFAMNLVCPQEEEYWFRRLLLKVTPLTYNYVSAQSQYCLAEWIKVAALDTKKCSHIWSSADLSRFKATNNLPQRHQKEVFNLVTVGRLHPMKGHIWIIEAINILKDKRIKLKIVGDGNQRLEIESKIKSYELNDAVELIGNVENPEDYIRDSDCFVLMSQSHESCPAVLSEAMAMGLPLITSDFGPLPQVNEDNITGIVVASRDSQALARAILKLADSPELCRQMGSAGLNKAEAEYGRDKMIAETILVYEQLVMN